MANQVCNIYVLFGWDTGPSEALPNVSVAVHKRSDNSFVTDAACDASTGKAVVTVDNETDYWLYVFGLNLQPVKPVRFKYHAGAPEYIELGKGLVA